MYGSDPYGAAPLGETLNGAAPTTIWSIEGPDGSLRAARANADATLTPRSLSVSFVADDRAWLDFASAGDLETVTGFGGRFRVRSRDSGGTIRVEPPTALQPAVQPGPWYLDDVASSQLNSAARGITLEFLRGGPRDGPVGSQSSGTDYQLSLPGGASIGLAADQVLVDERAIESTGERITPPLVLSSPALRVLAARVDRPAAVVERPVPDDESFAVDSSPQQRQTISVSSPASAPLSDGSYLVVEWSATALATETGRWEVSIGLLPQ